MNVLRTILDLIYLGNPPLYTQQQSTTGHKRGRCTNARNKLSKRHKSSLSSASSPSPSSAPSPSLTKGKRRHGEYLRERHRSSSSTHPSRSTEIIQKHGFSREDSSRIVPTQLPLMVLDYLDTVEKALALLVADPRFRYILVINHCHVIAIFMYTRDLLEDTFKPGYDFSMFRLQLCYRTLLSDLSLTHEKCLQRIAYGVEARCRIRIMESKLIRRLCGEYMSLIQPILQVQPFLNEESHMTNWEIEVWDALDIRRSHKRSMERRIEFMAANNTTIEEIYSACDNRDTWTHALRHYSLPDHVRKLAGCEYGDTDGGDILECIVAHLRVFFYGRIPDRTHKNTFTSSPLCFMLPQDIVARLTTVYVTASIKKKLDSLLRYRHQNKTAYVFHRYIYSC